MQSLAMMSHLMANNPQKANRLFQEAAESLQEAIGDADILRKYPTECVREFKMRPHESVVTDVVVDTSDIPNTRYHDRMFPKDYDKKKKAKRRQQKLSRRRNK